MKNRSNNKNSIALLASSLPKKSVTATIALKPLSTRASFLDIHRNALINANPALVI
jgi:hypothetical protein